MCDVADNIMFMLNYCEKDLIDLVNGVHSICFLTAFEVTLHHRYDSA